MFQSQEDVGCVYQTIGTNALLRVVVNGMCLSQQIGIRHQRRQHLLVAILRKLLTEGCQRIKLCSLRGNHLEFVIHEQVNIFVNGLLVNNALRVVLVI